MSVVIYWFRNDLRLTDNPALHKAVQAGTRLLPVVCHAPAVDAMTGWGFTRVDLHRRAVLQASLADLGAQLRGCGSDLIELAGAPAEVLPALAQALDAEHIFCEQISAPEEEDEVAALRAQGMQVTTIWQSSMLDPSTLPFAIDRLPDQFTAFRHAVEKAAVVPLPPLAAPIALPPLPDQLDAIAALRQPADGIASCAGATDARSSYPYHRVEFAGGATAADAHLRQYFARKLAHTYKQTRNGVTGTDYSSKFSAWLASGALSARSAYAALKQFEQQHGANDGSYWLWFELLWRDYFRFLHLKYGRVLYRARGLAGPDKPLPKHHKVMFKRWCNGTTGEPLVDAGMRELAATGYLSNRLRQIVASYLIHDLGGDWRAGAAWFEAQLVDYDVYSNQGNWLYLAGCGTDPRGSRRFNMQKQAADYDRDGAYRALWNG